MGHEDIKETVSKMVLYFIAQCSKQPRRSKRRRSSRIKQEAKRPRLFSCTSEEDDLDDGGEFDPETDSAKMALIALLTHTLQGGEGDSSDDEELEDPPFCVESAAKE